MRRDRRTGRQLHLASATSGRQAIDIEIDEVVAPHLASGQILVRNVWLELTVQAPPCCSDPLPCDRLAIRGLASLDGAGQGETVLRGTALGQVVESRATTLPVGAWVVHGWGTGELAAVAVERAIEVDAGWAAHPERLGATGADGMTAYVAVAELAEVSHGDVVLVSGASGRVGGIAAQLARRLGAAAVVGAEEGLERTLAAADLGFDAVLDAAAGPIAVQLADAAPDGIDVYVHVEGDEPFEAALDAFRPRGRAVMIGVAGTARRRSLGPANLGQIAAKNLSIRGVSVGDDLWPGDVERAMARLGDVLVPASAIRVDGLDQVPETLGNLTMAGTRRSLLVRLPARAADDGLLQRREITEEYFTRLVGAWSDELESGT
jgi:NADPH-dependent curcumin reductase CurA